MSAVNFELPEAFIDLVETKSRYKVYYGGRGGAKSWAFAIALLGIGISRSIRVLCARELQVSIKDSVHKLLSDIIGSDPVLAAFYTVTDKAIRGSNGTEFAFKGLKHNSTEIKSFEGVDYAWIEEAQIVSDKSWEILIPTIRKEGSEIWIGYNPKNPTDPTHLRFVTNKRRNSVVKKVSWRDNPFFPSVLEEERLNLLETDPEAYAHIWEGEFDTRYSGAVYAKWVQQEKISPDVLHDPNYPVYTAWDMGYGDTNVIIFFQIGAGEIFIIDYYESNQQDILHYCEVLFGRKIIVNQRDMRTGEVLDAEFGEDIPEHAHRKEYTYEPNGHNAPHDAANKLQAAGGKSIIMQAKKLGVHMRVWQQASQIDSQQALRSVLPKCWINQTRCKDFIHALMHYHYEYDEERKMYKKDPYHDWSSHPCDAAEIMARAAREKVITTKEVKERQHIAEFHRRRAENNLDDYAPYRTKPVRK